MLHINWDSLLFNCEDSMILTKLTTCDPLKFLGVACAIYNSNVPGYQLIRFKRASWFLYLRYANAKLLMHASRLWEIRGLCSIFKSLVFFQVLNNKIKSTLLMMGPGARLSSTAKAEILNPSIAPKGELTMIIPRPTYNFQKKDLKIINESRRCDCERILTIVSHDSSEFREISSLFPSPLERILSDPSRISSGQFSLRATLKISFNSNHFYINPDLSLLTNINNRLQYGHIYIYMLNLLNFLQILRWIAWYLVVTRYHNSIVIRFN